MLSVLSFSLCNVLDFNIKVRFKMQKLVSMILGFIQTAITASLIGSAVCLVAGEVRLACLKKTSQGSSKLAPFTQKMTGMKFP